MAAVASSLFVGIWGFYGETWGFYDGVSIPLPCIVAFVGLVGWGLTRRLSKLDWKRRQEKRGRDSATSLELGPADTWWDNGVAAVKVGWYLLILPIVFDIYIAWNTGKVSLIGYPFGLQDALGAIISIVIGWVSGIFMFGALMPYWRGVRTPIKGAIFGLISFASFAADAGVRQALGLTPNPVFIVDGLLAVVLFGTAGLLLDVRTLQMQNNLGRMSSIYRLGSVRVAVTYATTLIIVALGLWQAIYLTSLTTQQRAQTISNTTAYFEGIGGSRLAVESLPSLCQSAFSLVCLRAPLDWRFQA